jgi:hypothetical protein
MKLDVLSTVHLIEKNMEIDNTYYKKELRREVFLALSCKQQLGQCSETQ